MDNFFILPVTNIGPPGLGCTWGWSVIQTGALGVTTCILVSCATGGLVMRHGHARYSARQELTSFPAASRSVLELFIGLSGAETMNLWPRGHSYSNPRNTLTVILESAGSSGLRRLAFLAAFSTMFGHLSASSLVVTLVRGISQGSRNLELDMKPGWAPRPEEWE